MAKKAERNLMCLCCGQELPYSSFYKSQSPMFKATGKCPICKECMLDIYEQNLQFYKDEDIALFKTLYSLDYVYDTKLVKFANDDVQWIDGKYLTVIKTNVQ